MPNHYNAQPQANPEQAAAADLGKVSKMMGLIANKNAPPLYKKEIWNATIARTLGDMMGGDGLPSFDVWPEALDDYVVRADKILNDKKFQNQDKMAAMKGLMAEAETDIALAPTIRDFKKSAAVDRDYDVLRMTELMESQEDGEVTDQEAREFAEIRERNPDAINEALEIKEGLAAHRMAGGEEGIEAGEEGIAEEEAGSQLDRFLAEQGFGDESLEPVPLPSPQEPINPGLPPPAPMGRKVPEFKPPANIDFGGIGGARLTDTDFKQAARSGIGRVK